MFTRWISLIIIAMIVAALYFSLRPKKWEQTEEEAGAGSSDEVGIAAEQSVEKAP